jgi:hypothetical protein
MRARIGAAAALAAAMILFGFAAVPRALACTGDREPCPGIPFRQWVGPRAVAIYRFDWGRSSWSRLPSQQPDVPDAPGCLFQGTFVFRRVEALKGDAPETVVSVVHPAYFENCPEWDQDVAWGRVPASPAGRWVLVLGSDLENGHSAWLHLDAGGGVDTAAIGDFGWPDIPGAPGGTLAGIRAALLAPDTATADPQSPGPVAPVAPLLLFAAVGGLALGLRRAQRAGPARR